jgi:UDP-N-acetylglucosamine diphosphorylase/glucosamine-1-phosphate N-acetyltransferase
MAARKVGRPAFVCRSYVAPLVERAWPGHLVNRVSATDDLLFLNGAALFFKGELERFLRQLGDHPVLESGGRLVAARVRGDEARKLLSALSAALEGGASPVWPRGLKPRPVTEAVRFMSRPWDLVGANEATLIDDFALTRPGKEAQLPTVSAGAHLVKKTRILSRSGARLMTGAVLDASTGPIILGEGVRILHNAVVLGPAYIGPNSVIKVGAKIYGGTSIGPVCKVGGEVEGSILHGYANKQHEGFLGHSYLGEWTNIGAGSDTSDLKNNYGTVRVTTPEGDIDTGQRFVGLCLGDHSKCGIGTMFNTGTIVGVMSNVYGAGYTPKHIPSFSWGGPLGLEEYDLEKALQVAAVVTARRNRVFEPIDEALYRRVFAMTAAHRAGAGG